MGVCQAGLVATKDTLYSLGRVSKGIGGRKAAKLFTREERGWVKHIYHRRKVVWEVMGNLIHSGLTAQVACDTIYNILRAWNFGDQHHQLTKG